MVSKKRKGIILAGGHGKRMSPCSLAVNKQLFPVFDKPLIYYPLSTLMFSGIREILIIVSPNSLEQYKRLLGDGSQWGLQISFAIQPRPEGIAQAFLIAENFIGNDLVCLILGDNILFGDALPNILMECAAQVNGATIFGYAVKDPCQYGILQFDEQHNVIDIEEKPKNTSSNYAVIGIYYYDNQIIDIAKTIKPSARGELEITDVNRMYLAEHKLSVRILGRGMAWLDAGTPRSLLEAANFIYALEERQGLKICCPEEIAWRLKYIDDAQLEKIVDRLGKCEYSIYLQSLLTNKSVIKSIHSDMVLV